MGDWNYVESTFNCYDEIKPLDSKERLKHVLEAIRSKDSFFDFAKTGQETKSLALCSFILAGEMAKGDLKTSQLRKFYNYVKNLQYEAKDSERLETVLAKLNFLLPRLAGAAAKQDSIMPLYRTLAACLSKKNINEEDDVLTFIEFLEATLNYFEVLSREKKEFDSKHKGDE